VSSHLVERCWLRSTRVRMRVRMRVRALFYLKIYNLRVQKTSEKRGDTNLKGVTM
jgi:hypothetical protein